VPCWVDDPLFAHVGPPSDHESTPDFDLLAATLVLRQLPSWARFTGEFRPVPAVRDMAGVT